MSDTTCYRTPSLLYQADSSHLPRIEIEEFEKKFQPYIDMSVDTKKRPFEDAPQDQQNRKKIDDDTSQAKSFVSHTIVSMFDEETDSESTDDDDDDGRKSHEYECAKISEQVAESGGEKNDLKDHIGYEIRHDLIIPRSQEASQKKKLTKKQSRNEKFLSSKEAHVQNENTLADEESEWENPDLFSSEGEGEDAMDADSDWEEESSLAEDLEFEQDYTWDECLYEEQKHTLKKKSIQNGNDILKQKKENSLAVRSKQTKRRTKKALICLDETEALEFEDDNTLQKDADSDWEEESSFTEDLEFEQEYILDECLYEEQKHTLKKKSKQNGNDILKKKTEFEQEYILDECLYEEQKHTLKKKSIQNGNDILKQKTEHSLAGRSKQTKRRTKKALICLDETEALEFEDDNTFKEDSEWEDQSSYNENDDQLSVNTDEETELCNNSALMNHNPKNKREEQRREETIILNKKDKTFLHLQESWNRRYEELVAYKKKHGHCSVPESSNLYRQLANWVNNQRKIFYNNAKDKNQPACVFNYRIERLNKIGFIWNVETIWEKRYNDLLKFKKEYGHCNVPCDWKKNEQLANWVNSQRIAYRELNDGNTNDEMTVDRIERLEKIGFAWNRSYDDSSWDKRYGELVAYKIKHGHNKIVASKILKSWSSTQRLCYKKFLRGEPSHLNAERIEKLDKVGFKGLGRVRKREHRYQSLWVKRYRDLVKFKKQYGHCKVPKSYKKKELVNWVSYQRRLHQKHLKGTLDTVDRERMRMLNNLDFEWVLSTTQKSLETLSASECRLI